MLLPDLYSNSLPVEVLLYFVCFSLPSCKRDAPLQKWEAKPGERAVLTLSSSGPDLNLFFIQT